MLSVFDLGMQEMILWQDLSSFVWCGLLLNQLRSDDKGHEMQSCPFVYEPQHLGSISLMWPHHVPGYGGLPMLSFSPCRLSFQLYWGHPKDKPEFSRQNTFFFFLSPSYIAGWYFVSFVFVYSRQCIFVYWLSKEGRKEIVKWG